MLLVDYLPFSEVLLVTIPGAKLVPVCVAGSARSPGSLMKGAATQPTSIGWNYMSFKVPSSQAILWFQLCMKRCQIIVLCLKFLFIESSVDFKSGQQKKKINFKALDVLNTTFFDANQSCEWLCFGRPALRTPVQESKSWISKGSDHLKKKRMSEDICDMGRSHIQPPWECGAFIMRWCFLFAIISCCTRKPLPNFSDSYR